jgi:hypothetical protein
MRKAVLSGIAVLALVASAYQVGQAQAQSKVSEFKITMQFNGSGLDAKCVQGCAWTSLSYRCEPNKGCRTEIDQLGVRGF